MRSFLLALQFLTVIPVRVQGDVTAVHIARSVGLYPLVGAVQGAIIALAAFPLVYAFPDDMAAALLLLLLIATNAGFHLDGLSDTLDGMAVKSSGNRNDDLERRLAVMKKGPAGPMGAAGITMALLLQFLGIHAIIGGFAGNISHLAAALFLMPMLAKWSMAAAIAGAKSARPDGLGKLVIEHAGRRELLTALGTAAAFTVAGAIAAPKSLSPWMLLLPAALYALAAGFRRCCNARFGGMTGDMFGALNELAQTGYLLLAGAWLRHSA